MHRKRPFPQFFRRFTCICFLFCVLLLTIVATTAQVDAQEPIVTGIDASDEPLIVGVYQNPPFAIAVTDPAIDGEMWDGLSVQLWREVADVLNINYEFQEVQRDFQVERIVDGTIDLAINAVVSAEGETEIDYTQVYHTTELGTAERREQTPIDVVRAVISRQFLSTALWIVVLLAIVGFLIWLLEGRNRPEVYGEEAHKGIWTGFWWAAVTMSTIGYGDVVPKSTGGRALALVWILLAMVITASLTATITTVLTLTSGFQPVAFPEGLQDMTVGIVDGSASSEVLDAENIDYNTYETAVDAMQALRNSEIDVFVDNMATLRYVRNQATGPLDDINIQSTGRVPQSHAFALPAGSDLREPINRIILQRINSAQWHEVLTRYIPED